MFGRARVNTNVHISLVSLVHQLPVALVFTIFFSLFSFSLTTSFPTDHLPSRSQYPRLLSNVRRLPYSLLLTTFLLLAVFQPASHFSSSPSPPSPCLSLRRARQQGRVVQLNELIYPVCDEYRRPSNELSKAGDDYERANVDTSENVD